VRHDRNRERETTMSATIQVYVVRDASGEYLRANGTRTPAGNEAHEHETREEAEAACERATDRVLSRDAE
jgi:hypothetical protein